MAKITPDLLQFGMPAEWRGEQWREGLFTGNGTIGVNVLGNICHEKIIINDSHLSWRGRPSVVPDISIKLKTLRKMLFDSNFLDAQSVMTTALGAKNFRPMQDYPLPVCQLSVDFVSEGAKNDYRRTVNLASGEVTVSYKLDETKVNRRLFVSRDNNTVVYQIAKQGNTHFNATFAFNKVEQYIDNNAQDKLILPEGMAISYDKDCMMFALRNDDDGTDFGVVAKFIVEDGQCKFDGQKLIVNNATNILVLTQVFSGMQKTKAWKTLCDNLNAIKDNYDKQLKAHQTLHNKLYSKVTLSLAKDSDKTVEQLIVDSKVNGLSAELLDCLYKYGRYLTVCCTADNGALMPFVGMWNGSYLPYRAYKSNAGELQMAYKHALSGNIAINYQQLFSYFENNVGDYQNNAIRLYGSRGIFVPVVTSGSTGRLGSSDVVAVHFSGCGAWISNMFFAFAKQQNDTKFIKSHLLPFMKEVALFYQDFLTETQDGTLSTVPSVLPIRLGDSEKLHDKPLVAKNSALDFAIARHFFENYITALTMCGNKNEDIATYKDLIDKLPTYQLASDNTIKEFFNSTVSLDYSGVSVGTLYPAYYSNEVDILADSAVKKAYLMTANKKLLNADKLNSFTMSILISVYARLGESSKAVQCLQDLVMACCLNNLALVEKDWRGMGYCGNGTVSPVSLQSNMVVCNIVQEMLLYAHDNIVCLLPSTPSSWQVNFEGLLTDNGISVSISTNSDKHLITAELTAPKDMAIDLYLPQGCKKVLKSNIKQVCELHSDRLCYKNLQLSANKTYSIVWKE